MILDSGGQGTIVGGALSPPRVPGVGRKVVLHIGVLDQPYRTATRAAQATTTGDVAKILEEKYGLFSVFYKAREQGIANSMAVSMVGALEGLFMGRYVDPWGPVTQYIQREFRTFISTKEAERVGMPGVPTKAALRGVNHRLAHPYRRSNPRRPSFRDTGLLMASARAWVTVD